MKVKYIRCTEGQANFGRSCDPRGILEVNHEYELERKEVHTWHTLYYLKGISKPFNSVCFEDKDNG